MLTVKVIHLFKDCFLRRTEAPVFVTQAAKFSCYNLLPIISSTGLTDDRNTASGTFFIQQLVCHILLLLFRNTWTFLGVSNWREMQKNPIYIGNWDFLGRKANERICIIESYIYTQQIFGLLA